MKLQILLFSIIILFSTHNLFSQENTEFKKINFESEENFNNAIIYLAQGDSFYADGEEWYSKAITKYLKANELNPNNADLNYRIGICYYSSNDIFKSDKYIKTAYKLNPKVNNLVLYRLAEASQSKLKLDNAISLYTKFKNEYDGKKKKKWLEKTNKRLEECNNGKELTKNHVGGLVKNIQRINSKYIDHSPIITQDEQTIYFTSQRPNESGKGEMGEYNEDIYVSKKDKNGNWQKAVNIGEPINTELHDASVGVSSDGKTLYIYRGDNKGDIYQSSFENGVWTEPIAFPSPINSKHSETAISFSPNNKYLYFVSNRPGGIGGKDIWKSEILENGDYKTPEVLSKTINTEYDERAVFIHPDGKTMYFSSEGHKTMGGFDIFKSTMDENGNWGEPLNIGYPVNTSGHDVFFVTSADNRNGYFSAIKLQSKGEQDIYQYIFPEKVEDSIIPVIRGYIKDESTNEPLIGIITFSNNETGKKKIIKTDPKNGEFLASIEKGSYSVNISSEGYTMLSKSIIIESSEDKNFLLGMDMNILSDCKPILLENIRFDFDKSNIKEKSFAELNELSKFLKSCNQYNIEISGYTCNMGLDSYNYLLSKRRANSVVKYLIDKGINKKRLSSIGKGPENPISDNSSKAGRIKNRRIEFTLINK